MARKTVMKLTTMQRLWLEAYLRTFNATEAARVAGYKYPNKNGPANLEHPKLREAIEERLEEAAMSANEVLARLSQQAAGSMADFITVDEKGGARLDLKKALGEGRLGLVKKFVRSEGKYGTSVRIELHDAQAALVQLGRYHGLFTDRVDHTTGGEPVAGVRIYLPDNGRDTDDDGNAE